MTGIMDLLLLQKFFYIYSWLAASMIMVFVAGIALFYQKKFGKKTFSYFYIIPIIIMLIPAIPLFPAFSFFAELIEFTGSLVSFSASYFLYKKMVGVK